MDCKCETDNPDDVAGWWMNTSNVHMGAFTVVGYLLYRFSQTLPALIRWPIRLFCSLTGLTALWGWVSHLVGTLRAIKSVVKMMSRIWKFIVAFTSKSKWLVKAITGSSGDGPLETDPSSGSMTTGFRLILLGPTGGGRTSMANTLLGCSAAETVVSMMESTKRTAAIGGRVVTVINTPGLLDKSWRSESRAREALRSLQLAGPGPHAFLLILLSPFSSPGLNQDATEAVQAIVELFGDEVLGYILPVLTHADRLDPKRTVEQLLDIDMGGLKTAVSLCGQKPVLLDNRPDLPTEGQSVMRREVMGRVMEMNALRGHFVHKLQRKEDQIREELLANMASELTTKLERM